MNNNTSKTTDKTNNYILLALSIIVFFVAAWFLAYERIDANDYDAGAAYLLFASAISTFVWSFIRDFRLKKIVLLSFTTFQVILLTILAIKGHSGECRRIFIMTLVWVAICVVFYFIIKKQQKNAK